MLSEFCAVRRQLVNVYQGRIMYRQVMALQPCDNVAVLLPFHFLNESLAGDLGEVNDLAIWLLSLSE